MKTPIYLKIKNTLLEEIEDKPINTPIASERDLAEKYCASRMTVRNAVNELVAEGYLYRVKNKGTFVADRKLIRKNTSADVLRTSDDMKYTIMYFSVKPAGAEIAPHLEIRPEELIIRIVRVNRKGSKAVSVEELYYIRDFISDEDVKDLKKLLDINQYMEHGSVVQRFLPMNVPVKYVNFLHVKVNLPIIMVESTILSKSGKPLVYIRQFNNPQEHVIEITS